MSVATNAALWQLAERIRQVDALCDEAQARGVTEAPPALRPLGWGLGMMLWCLERARRAEQDDPFPAGTCYGYEKAAGVFPAIEALLHDAARRWRLGNVA